MSEVLLDALEIPVDKQHRGFEMRVSKVMRRNGWTNTDKRVNGRIRKVWERGGVATLGGEVATGGNTEELF